MKRYLILAILLFYTPAMAIDFNGYMHWIKPSTPGTIEWDGDGDGYEVYLWQMEGGTRFLSGRITTEKYITINWSTNGHYVAYVRQYNDIAGVRQWTPWIRSIDAASATVGGVAHPWIVYVAPF